MKYIFALVILAMIPNASIARQPLNVPALEIAELTAPSPLAMEQLQQFFDGVAKPCQDFECFEKHKKGILGELSNHEVAFNLLEIKGEGKVSVFQNFVAAKGRRIVLQRDHRSFKKIKDGTKTRDAGFLIRIEVALEVISGEVELSSLFSAAASAKAGKTEGNLKVMVYGLSGKTVMGLLPSPSDLSEASIQAAMESVALIKSKVYDPDVTVIPQDLL